MTIALLILSQGMEKWVNASQVEPSLYVESNYSKEWRFNYANIPSEGNAELQVRLYEVSSYK